MKLKFRFRYLVYATFLGLGFLMLVGFVIRKQWGRDLTTLEITKDDYVFTAKRDALGAWQLKVPTRPSLWFGMGYVQSLDREFQLELLRRAATGRLGEWFGAKVLESDLLMRHLVEVAKWDWQTHQNDPLIRESIESFIAGRNHYLKTTQLPIPFEYRALAITRESITPWEPWELLAISRFHSWQFSYDYRQDLDAHTLAKVYPKALLDLLQPLEGSAPSPTTMYSQLGVQNSLRQVRKWAETSLGSPFQPTGKMAQNNALAPKRDFERDHPVSGKKLRFDSPEQGASNLWIVSNPKVALPLTLCNDPHLNLNWPSSLYPLQYDLSASSNQPAIRGTGFMLPGIPGLMIGRVRKEDSDLAWGITLATFADTQDLISVPHSTLKSAAVVTQTEKFTLHNAAENQAPQVETAQLEWTPWGPRVDQFLKIPGVPHNQAVVLDWFGFHKTPTTLGFFLKRTTNGLENLEVELQRDFTYPAVNYTWIAKPKGKNPQVGHMVTGWIIERDRAKMPQGLVPLSEPRRFSSATERPYLKYEDTSMDSFLLVSGNQKIWDSKQGNRLAYEYTDEPRAKRLIDNQANLSIDPSSGQRDAYIPALKEFWTQLRLLIDTNRLCGSGERLEMEQCRQLVTALDAWNGVGDRERFETTLLATLFVRLKWELWPSAPNDDKQVVEAKLRWIKSTQSHRALRALLANSSLRQQWAEQRQLKQSFADLGSEHFGKILAMLRQAHGLDERHWRWGTHHKVSWSHPFLLMPEPISTLLNDSLFGPLRPVPGAFDSPQRFDISWKPESPLVLNASHGSVIRLCTNFHRDSSKDSYDWANSTGVSGNPFSQWAREMPEETYFRDKLVNAWTTFSK